MQHKTKHYLSALQKNPIAFEQGCTVFLTDDMQLLYYMVMCLHSSESLANAGINVLAIARSVP